jgi:NADH-quinone oxidoreductase subunit N
MSIITLFFSIFPKITLIFFFIKISYFVFLFNLNLFLTIIGILSVIVGFINAMFQFKIKRFLAYSSIFTIGFLLIILSQANIDSFFVVIFYLICYSITLMSFFFLLLHIRLKSFKEIFYLYDLSVITKTNIILSYLLIILFFSFAGVPPLIGFFGKFYLFLYLINNCNYFLVFFVFIAGVISSFYYVRIVRILMFNNLTGYNKLIIKELSFFVLFLLILNIIFFLFFDFIGEFIFLSLFKTFLI